MLPLQTTTIRRDSLGLTTTTRPIVRAELSAPDRIRRQMAFDLRGLLATAGGVASEDLELIGWSKPQIKAHAEDAIALARRQAGVDGGEG